MCWLLFVVCALLFVFVVRALRFDIGFARCAFFVVCCCLLFVRCLSLVACCSLFVVGCVLLVVCCYVRVVDLGLLSFVDCC